MSTNFLFLLSNPAPGCAPSSPADGRISPPPLPLRTELGSALDPSPVRARCQPPPPPPPLSLPRTEEGRKTDRLSQNPSELRSERTNDNYTLKIYIYCGFGIAWATNLVPGEKKKNESYFLHGRTLQNFPFPSAQRKRKFPLNRGKEERAVGNRENSMEV